MANPKQWIVFGEGKGKLYAVEFDKASVRDGLLHRGYKIYAYPSFKVAKDAIDYTADLLDYADTKY